MNVNTLTKRKLCNRIDFEPTCFVTMTNCLLRLLAALLTICPVAEAAFDFDAVARFPLTGGTWYPYLSTTPFIQSTDGSFYGVNGLGVVKLTADGGIRACYAL